MEMFKVILILLSSAVVLVVLCRRLHLPPIIGYLFVGILVGPGGFRWLHSIEEMHALAEFGVVFLMFTLGLEFSIPRLIANRRALLGIGGLQVALCALVLAAGAVAFGIDVTQSIIIGCGLALSSTAVVIKQLNEQKEQMSSHGNMAINMLLFQDLAAVFLLIAVPALSSDTPDTLTTTFLITTGKGVLACVCMAMIGIWILRPLFHEVAKARSTELFMIATLLVALSAAGITYYLGLSMALGAFLAGLMLGETEFKHQIELDIRPFRDVLLGLFFIVIGAYLEVNLFPKIWKNVLIFIVVLIVSKWLIIACIARWIGRLSPKASIRCGIIMAHGGEFSFVVLTEALAYHLVPEPYLSEIFATVVISVLLAPLMIRYNSQIASLFIRSKEVGSKPPQSSYHLTEHAAELSNHVIICGFGRVGQILARFLDQENFQWLALDLDPMRISKSSIAGEHSFYGDARNPNTLSAAGLARARMVVVTYGDEHYSMEVLQNVRGLRLDVPVFVRTKDDGNLEQFQTAGATEVVPEALEGSIMLASHLLLTLGVPTQKIMNKVRKIHTNRYENLRGFYKGTDDSTAMEDEATERRSLHALYVPESAHIVYKKLGILNLPEGVNVRMISRANRRMTDVTEDVIVIPGDVVVIFASPEEAVVVEEQLLGGE